MEERIVTHLWICIHLNIMKTLNKTINLTKKRKKRKRLKIIKMNLIL